MATTKVGGEIDAFCTRCKLSLAHTILAMIGTKVARVRCNTCNADHAYRNEPGARSSRAGAARAPAAKKTVLSFDQRLSERDVGKAKKYRPQETFAVDDVVDHPTFGLGIVNTVRGDKMDVAFKAATRTLVHARTQAPIERPHYEPPKVAPDSPSDKPVDGTGEPQAEAPVPTPS